MKDLLFLLEYFPPIKKLLINGSMNVIMICIFNKIL